MLGVDDARIVGMDADINEDNQKRANEDADAENEDDDAPLA